MRAFGLTKFGYESQYDQTFGEILIKLFISIVISMYRQRVIDRNFINKIMKYNIIGQDERHIIWTLIMELFYLLFINITNNNTELQM